jgi:PAS domain S-box-containing protein
MNQQGTQRQTDPFAPDSHDSAEFRLKECEDRFQHALEWVKFSSTILESIRLPAMILDAEGRVQFCNPSLLAMTGLERSRIEGALWHEAAIPEIERRLVEEVFLKSKNTATVASLKHKLLTAKGPLKTVAWNLIPLPASDGAVVGFYDYDLVMVDQSMPDMTGLELSQKIHSVRKEMPVILCTDNSDNLDSRKLKAARIQKTLVKPISAKDLAREIRAVFVSQVNH